jgi:hypothetical protein
VRNLVTTPLGFQIERIETFFANACNQSSFQIKHNITDLSNRLYTQIVEVASYIAKLQGDESETPAYVSALSEKLSADKQGEVLNQIATDSAILLSAPVKGKIIFSSTVI